MGAHMKTTIDISDSLFAEARRIADREGSTLRALVEAGLHKVIAERRQPGAPFKLRRASVKGRGLRPELQGASWDRLRELAYEERGA
jgi:Arc/MetJ family transcription regulator